MIVKIRVPENTAPDQVMVGVKGQAGWRMAKVVEIIPELTEKEQLLSKIFNLNTTQGFKEILAEIINKVYKDK